MKPGCSLQTVFQLLASRLEALKLGCAAVTTPTNEGGTLVTYSIHPWVVRWFTI
jgi:hypothetical protein